MLRVKKHNSKSRRVYQKKYRIDSRKQTQKIGCLKKDFNKKKVENRTCKNKDCKKKVTLVYRIL